MTPEADRWRAVESGELVLRIGPDERERLRLLARAKGLSAEDTAVELVRWSLSSLEEFPPSPDQTIAQDLEFCRALRMKNQERLDQLLALAELTLLDTKALESALRARANANADEEPSG